MPLWGRIASLVHHTGDDECDGRNDPLGREPEGTNEQIEKVRHGDNVEGDEVEKVIESNRSENLGILIDEEGEKGSHP